MIKGHKKEDLWEDIKEWQKDPEFIRAAYEFVRYHTGGRRNKSLKSK